MSGLDTPSKSEVDEVEDLASDVANNTMVSEKQATALILREVLNATNKRVADVLSVASPASASSYVTRCRSKFDSVDEEISELEQRIDEWERTEQLQDIVVESRGFDEFHDRVESQIVRDEDVKYAVSYIDDSGEEDLLLTEESPQELDVKVVDYKRVSSTEELFE
mgnify:CR=1 FL=1